MRKLILLLSISFFIASCCVLRPSKCKDNEATFETISNNVTTPQYLPLNLPISSIPLPSLLVGNGGLPSGGCFENSTEQTTVNAPDSLIQLADREKKFEAGLKAEFEKAMIKVGVEAAISRALTQSFTTKAYGISIVQIDPANTFANFENTNCNSSELDWFVDNRTVIIAGVKADSLIINMESGLTSEQKAKIDAVIDTLNIELGLSFNRMVQSSGEFRLSAKEVFFGALTSSLTVKKCEQKYKTKLSKGESDIFSYCKENYTVTLKRSLSGDRFTINLFDKYNSDLTTGELDIPINKPFSAIVGNNRKVNFFIQEKNKKNSFSLKITMYLVGVSGQE